MAEPGDDTMLLLNGEAQPADAPVRPEPVARCSRIAGWIGVFTIVLAVFGFLPWGIIELRRQHAETHVQAWFAAGVFVCLAVPMTLWDITMHLRHWNNPVLQRHIIRIMLMVPVYAVDSWLALRFKSVNIYIDTLRECYEAYVIYNFMVYLLQFLRQRPDFDEDISKRPPVKHIFPFCCLPAWPNGQEFVNKCTHGVASYVIVRLLTTLVALVTALTDSYGEGEINGRKSYVYIVAANSISQGWAMYSLVLFYYAYKEDLKPIKPVAKFLSVKLVIFFSFWQAFVVALLVATNVIKQDDRWNSYTQQSVASGIQDFLICVEMFLAAVAHHYIFSYKEHRRDDGVTRRIGLMSAARVLFDVRDVADTLFDHVQTVATLDGRLIKRSTTRRENTALLTGQSSSLLQAPMPTAAATSRTYGSTQAQNAQASSADGPASSV